MRLMSFRVHAFPAALAIFSGLMQFPAIAVNPATTATGEATTSPVMTVEEIGRYDLERLAKIMTTELVEHGFADTAPTNFGPATTPVRLYRISYPSVIPEQFNRPTRASGLIAIPETLLPGRPVVCYQHGTIFTKDEVPSNPEKSMETRLMVAQFAGQGYIVVAADYFGKGLSPEPDSYLVQDSTQQACTDLLLASRSALVARSIEPGPLFLSGWSQGGWATLVLLRHLERLGIDVRAAATASAPSDIYTTMNRWINNPQPIDTPWLTGCVAIQVCAQDRYVQPGLADLAFKPEYLGAARDLHENRIGWEEFSKCAPRFCGDMLRPEFIESGWRGDNPYWLRLQGEHGYRWRSHTPLRCYYGEVDEVTPVFIARLPEGFQAIVGGGPTEAIDAGPHADHRGTFLFSVAHEKKWFDDLLR